MYVTYLQLILKQLTVKCICNRGENANGKY